MLSSLKANFLIGAVLISVIGLGYGHYTGLLKSIEEQGIENSNLKIAIESSNAINLQLNKAILDWKESQDKFVKNMEKLTAVSLESQQEARRLNETFAKNNIKELAVKDAGFLENRINERTSDMFRMFECSTSFTGKDCYSKNRETEKSSTSSETSAGSNEKNSMGDNNPQ